MIKYAKDCKSLCGKKGTMPTIEVYTHEDSMYYLLVHESEQTPGDSDGQGSLLCCSPWGHKESDTTERLNNSNKGSQVTLLYERKIPWRREWLPSPVFVLGNSMDRGAWLTIVHGGHKELDITDQLSLF